MWILGLKGLRAFSYEPGWQGRHGYREEFHLGFKWEISAQFPRWEKAKDPGDEIWHQIQETKQTWRNTKNLTFTPIIASVTPKAAVKWDAYDVKNTTGNARQCHPDRQNSSRFYPSNRDEVFKWQNFQPAYQHLGNWASSASHMNTSKISQKI